MGDYFKDEEEETEDNKEQEEEEDIKAKIDLNNLINERNKIHHELNVRTKEYGERIGRINLDLFGDPENEDWVSRLDELSEEMEHPMTKTHPIAHKTKAVVRLIKDLQKEYRTLHAFYSKYVKEIGTLLDNSLNLAIQQEKAIKEMAVAGTDEYRSYEADKNITEGDVEAFMLTQGDKLVTKYFKGVDTNNRYLMLSAQASFVIQGKKFFYDMHPDPKGYSNRLWLHFVKKFSKERHIPIPLEPKPPQNKGLNKAESEDIEPKEDQDEEEQEKEDEPEPEEEKEEETIAKKKKEKNVK